MMPSFALGGSPLEHQRINRQADIPAGIATVEDKPADGLVPIVVAQHGCVQDIRVVHSTEPSRQFSKSS
jgi:hypothetical protein